MQQFGIHPSEIAETEKEIDEQILEIKRLVEENNKIVAIGEIGLDNHWEKDKSIILLPRQKT